jgi:hypothetical protein
VATTLLLQIDGTTVDTADLEPLVEVRAEEATGEADAVTLIARVDPSAAGEWQSLLDPLASPRTPLVVQLSRGGASYRFDGYSTEAVWDLDAEGFSRLTVKAIDRSLDLDAEEKVVAWPGTSDSGIAEAIFGSYGLGTEVQTTPDGPDPDVHVAFQRATDWAFVRALAAKWAYAAYLESADGEVVGHFHPVDPLADPQAELSLGHGGDAFRARVEARLLAGQRVSATRVPALSVSPQTGEAAGDDEAQGATSLGGQVSVLLTPLEVSGEVEPERAAQSLARRSAFGVTLTAAVDTERVGRLLRARRPVLVKGLGELLSGRYLVDRVRHTVTLAGHHQELTLTRNALGLRGDEPFDGGGSLGGLV